MRIYSIVGMDIIGVLKHTIKTRKLSSGKLVGAASVFLKKQMSNKNVNSTP